MAAAYELVKSYGIDPLVEVKEVQKICFDDALWAYVVGVALAIKVVSEVWDHFNVTVAESQEKIDNVNSKISELKSEIEELNSIQFKTDQQELRLKGLEKELELQERLLEIEQKRYYQELKVL